MNLATELSGKFGRKGLNKQIIYTIKSKDKLRHPLPQHISAEQGCVVSGVDL